LLGGAEKQISLIELDRFYGGVQDLIPGFLVIVGGSLNLKKLVQVLKESKTRAAATATVGEIIIETVFADTPLNVVEVFDHHRGISSDEASVCFFCRSDQATVLRSSLLQNVGDILASSGFRSVRSSSGAATTKLRPGS
jgi:hypothetical protein